MVSCARLVCECRPDTGGGACSIAECVWDTGGEGSGKPPEKISGILEGRMGEMPEGRGDAGGEGKKGVWRGIG